MRGRVPVGKLARFSYVEAFGSQSHKTANEPRRVNMSKLDDKDLTKVAAGGPNIADLEPDTGDSGSIDAAGDDDDNTVDFPGHGGGTGPPGPRAVDQG